MLKLIFLSALVLSIFSNSNAQTYTGKYSAYNPSNGVKVLLNLNQKSNGAVTGELILNDNDIYKISGKIVDESGYYALQGSIIKGNEKSFFEAYLESNQLFFTWIPTTRNNQPDYNSAIDVVLNKEGTSNRNNNKYDDYSMNDNFPNQNGRESGNYQRDPALVGLWRYSDSYTSGDFSLATEKYLEVNLDGTYKYGNGRVVGGGNSGTFDSGRGGDDFVTGRWRTENGIIYIDEGYGTWTPYCGYYVEGDKLMMKFNDGSKEIWYRLE